MELSWLHVKFSSFMTCYTFVLSHYNTITFSVVDQCAFTSSPQGWFVAISDVRLEWHCILVDCRCLGDGNSRTGCSVVKSWRMVYCGIGHVTSSTMRWWLSCVPRWMWSAVRHSSWLTAYVNMRTAWQRWTQSWHGLVNSWAPSAYSLLSWELTCN